MQKKVQEQSAVWRPCWKRDGGRARGGAIPVARLIYFVHACREFQAAYFFLWHCTIESLIKSVIRIVGSSFISL